MLSNLVKEFGVVFESSSAAAYKKMTTFQPTYQTKQGKKDYRTLGESFLDN